MLDIALRTRTLLTARGVRVAMTRTSAGYPGGNIERARYCNTRDASLMLRIHADGSTNPATRGVHTLYPALRLGWTDDVYAESVRAARSVQRAVIDSTGAPDLGLHRRNDLTGFNWADVPVVLWKPGFSNTRESRLLHSPAYRARVARGLAAGARAYLARG